MPRRKNLMRLSFMTVAVAMLTIQTSCQSRNKRWEYFITNVEFIGNYTEPDLNQFGKAGWELVDIENFEAENTAIDAYAVFKRRTAE